MNVARCGLAPFRKKAEYHNLLRGNEEGAGKKEPAADPSALYGLMRPESISF